MLHRIFHLAEWYCNILKSQYKCNLHLAKYINCNEQFNHSTSVNPITSLYNMLTITTLAVPRKEYMSLNQLKPLPLFKIPLLI